METKAEAADRTDANTASNLVNKFTDTWNRHDTETLMTMFHQQAVLINPAFPGPVSGNSMRAYLEAQLSAFPDLKAEVVGDTLVGSSTVGGRHLITGTWTKPMTAGPLAGMAPSGKAFTLQTADFIDIEDGKISKWTQYYDRMSLLTQLGVIPPGK